MTDQSTKQAVAMAISEQMSEAAKRHDMPMTMTADFGESTIAALAVKRSDPESILNAVSAIMASAAGQDPVSAFAIGVALAALPSEIMKRMDDHTDLFRKGAGVGAVQALKRSMEDDKDED